MWVKLQNQTRDQEIVEMGGKEGQQMDKNNTGDVKVEKRMGGTITRGIGEKREEKLLKHLP